MKNKNLIYFTLFIVFMITGCSYKQLTNEGQNSIQSPKSSNEKNINPYNYKDLSSLPKEYTFDIAKENGDVGWTHEEVYNLERLDNFMNNVQNDTKDMIRVVGFTKEGDAIIQDLEYNGEVINLTKDNTRDEFSENPSVESYEYKEIFIEKRYNKHYKGTFIKYFLKNDKEDNVMFILQIFRKE